MPDQQFGCSGQVLAFYAGYLDATSELAWGNVVSSKPSYLRFLEAMAMYDCESRTLALNSELMDDLPTLAAQVIPPRRLPPRARGLEPRRADRRNTKAAYIYNPNNPTGVAADPVALRAFSSRPLPPSAMTATSSALACASRRLHSRVPCHPLPRASGRHWA